MFLKPHNDLLAYKLILFFVFIIFFNSCFTGCGTSQPIPESPVVRVEPAPLPAPPPVVVDTINGEYDEKEEEKPVMVTEEMVDESDHAAEEIEEVSESVPQKSKLQNKLSTRKETFSSKRNKPEAKSRVPETYRTTTTTKPNGTTVTTTTPTSTSPMTTSSDDNTTTHLPSDVAYIDEDNTIIESGDNTTTGTGIPPIQNNDDLGTEANLDTAKSKNQLTNIDNDNVSVTDLDGNDISDCVSNLKNKGLAAWDTLPKVMYVGYDYQFQVLINHLSHGSEVLSQAAGKKINIEDVEVSEYSETTIAGHRAQIITIGDEVKLKLESLDKTAFSIRLLPDVKAIQKIDCDGAANWKWNIKPLQKGKYSLQMQISLKNKEGNFEFFDSFTRKIDVKVEAPWFASWYVYALIGLGIASIAYLIYVFTKTKSSNVTEVATASSTLGITNTSIPLQSTTAQSIIPKPNPSTLPHKVFLSYSHKDEEFKEKLDTHLSALKQTNIIDVWNDRQIPLGSEWDVEIKRELEESDVILLMISADFLASSYISEIEIPAAIARHDEGSAIVIPIFIRPCDWRGLPFEKLQGLPKNAKPLTTFDDIDVGLTEIAAGIRNRVS